MKPLPDLHQRAFTYKNHRRLKHDGGRSWIKDSQLYDSRRGINTYAVTTSADPDATAGGANATTAVAAASSTAADAAGTATRRLAEGTRGA